MIWRIPYPLSQETSTWFRFPIERRGIAVDDEQHKHLESALTVGDRIRLYWSMRLIWYCFLVPGLRRRTSLGR